MTGRLTASLREAPATVPALAAVVLLIAWATDQAGYPVTHWAPGGLVVLVLLGLAAAVARPRLRRLPPALAIALGCLAAYTALSFLSILWADAPGEAWEGADRTLLYLLVFALFACWPQRGDSAALVLTTWTLAMVGLAVFVALHLDAASGSSLVNLLPGGRLTYPSGYANANAALWLMAFWPALLLARERTLPAALRGLLAGGAVALAEVALLSQSRGSVYATAAMLVLVFALLPGRIRTFALLVPVAAGIAAGAPAVLRVGDHLHAGNVTAGAVHTAVAVTLSAAAAVGLAVALGAMLENRAVLSPAATATVRRGVGAAAVLTLVAVLAGGWIAAGNPVTRVERSWHSFKSGYSTSATPGSRLTSGLGSNRYDFYRVALDEFSSHPLVGIGVDNFQQQYLARGHSDETPRYPHSVELRTLAQTGVVGAILALVGLGAALAAAARAFATGAARRAQPLGAAVAAAALGGFLYWLVHGSVDWFWEFAGLGAPAFALLGLACALGHPQPAAGQGGEGDPGALAGERPGDRRSRAPGYGRLAAAGALVAALAAAASLAAPWLSQLEVQDAARIWTTAPRRAYQRLDNAAAINPLSDEPYLVAGSIAVRFNDLARAEHQFRLALQRTSHDAYATLELGAIAATRGRRAQALALLARAVRLSPRDQLARRGLQLVREGQQVSVQELNLLILRKAQQLA